MSNLHESPEWNNTGKVKKNEGSLAELAAILEIENHPEKQLSDLQRTIIEHNRKKADNSLAELETILHLSEATTDKNDGEMKEALHDPIQTVVLSKSAPPSKDTPPQIKIVPKWIQGALLWSTESIKVIIGSIKKFTLDLLLFPYDLYLYFQNKRKKIG